MPCSTRLARAMGKTRFSFSRPKKVSCFRVSISVLAGALPQFAGDVLIGDGQKAAGAAAGVVDGLARFRIDRVHHGADHLARGEELAAVGVLLAHLQQQVFIDLRQGEEVGVVDVVDVDLVDLVEDVAQVGFAVHPHPLHRRHDAADDALLARGRWVGQAGAGVDIQPVQMGQQFLVDEVEQLAVARWRTVPAASSRRACRRWSSGCSGLVRKGRGPVLPAVGTGKRRGESRSHRLGLVAAFSSWASRMRRNRIQVSSGTYCRALAQLERRMMSQIDLTKADSDWVEAMALGCFFREDFLVMRLFPVLSRSLQWWANSSAVARATSP